MQLPHYKFSESGDALNFQFESISDNRRILKLIQYEKIDESTDLYNLALVDVDENGFYSDLAISNNNDMPKVLATVAQTLVVFFRLRPKSRVIFRGSTPARTRLYRMAIAKYLTDLEQDFRILALINGRFVAFEKNYEYEAFVVQIKGSTL